MSLKTLSFRPFIGNKNTFLASEDKLPTRCPTAGTGHLWGAPWKKKIIFQQRATFLPAPLPSHTGLFCASVVNLHKDLLSAVQPEASKSTSIFGASPSASLLYLPQKDQDPRVTIFLLHSHVNHRGRSGGGKL